MIINKTNSRGGGYIKGNKYTAIANDDIYKNQICYVQGNKGFRHSNKIYGLNPSGVFSWVQLDSERVLVLSIDLNGNVIFLGGEVILFNDGDDKLTNPFISNTTKYTLIENFPYSKTLSYTLTKLDYPDRDICVFKYGTNYYFIEIKDKTNVTFLVKGGEPVNEATTYYSEVHSIPYEYITDKTTYNLLNFTCDENDTYFIATNYSFMANGKIINDANLSVNVTLGSKLLKVVLLPNGKYVAVISYSDGTKTTFHFYLITFNATTYDPDSISKINTFEQPYNCIDLFCNFDGSFFSITGMDNTTVNGTLYQCVFLFPVTYFNDVFNKNIMVRDVSVRISKITTSTYKVLQNFIIYGNYLYLITINGTNELSYTACDLNASKNHASSYRIDSTTGAGKAVMIQSTIPIIRNNMVYLLYSVIKVNKSTLYWGVMSCDFAIYPSIFNNFTNLNMWGISKDNYAKGETATIIHPTK